MQEKLSSGLMGRLVESLITRGNKKLDRDTAIFNMTTAHDCPSNARGLCPMRSICYALKAEVQYKSALKFREHQAELWDNVSVEDFANTVFNIGQKGKLPIKYLRFNEAGDFRHQADVDKVVAISKEIAKLYGDLDIHGVGVRVYMYTHGKDLDYTEAIATNNLTVNGSGFMLNNNFDAINDITELGEGDWLCNGDCRLCDACKFDNDLNIKVLIH